MCRQSRLLAFLPMLAAMALGLTASGSGNSNGLTAPMSQTRMNHMGQMSPAIADSQPADGAAHVVLVFTGVELTGNIQGQIKSALPPGCTPGVYLYSGIVTKQQDMNSASIADPNRPLASTVPVATSMPPYSYRFSFLPPGTYTVAFTCQAALDNPDQADPAVILTPVVTMAVTGTADIALGGIQG